MRSSWRGATWRWATTAAPMAPTSPPASCRRPQPADEADAAAARSRTTRGHPPRLRAWSLSENRRRGSGALSGRADFFDGAPTLRSRSIHTFDTGSGSFVRCLTPLPRASPSTRRPRSRGPTSPACNRSSSSTVCGSSPAAGTAGPSSSRRRGYARWRPAGPTTPRRSRRPRQPRRLRGQERRRRSPTTSTEVIRTLDRKPVVIGHSFGGLLTQILAGPRLRRGRRRDRPRAVPGRAAAAALGAEGQQPGPQQPRQPQPRGAAHLRAVPLLVRQRGRARRRRRRSTRPTRCRHRASRSSRPRSRTSTRARRRRSTRKNPERGPLLIISGEKDHTVPWAIANASYKQQAHNAGVTEIVEIPGRGHSLTIDSGWREVADTALKFVQRFV